MTDVKSEVSVTHAMARCNNCDFANDDYRIAKTLAEAHSANTGHVTTVEEGVWTTFKPVEKEQKQ